MSIKSRRDDPKYLSAFDRGMLRSAFVSLFWGVIVERRKRGGFTLQGLAKLLGANKGEVSRWFSTQPNWTLNTIANIASALDLDLQIRAVERSTGIIFTPSGVEHPVVNYVSVAQGVGGVSFASTSAMSLADYPSDGAGFTGAGRVMGTGHAFPTQGGFGGISPAPGVAQAVAQRQGTIEPPIASFLGGMAA
jgi:hypothetical protein